MNLISLLSFSTSFYILMNTVVPQIQATTNLGPSTPCPDYPLPISRTITVLSILVHAVGLATVFPQDGSPLLRLFIGITYVVSCVLLLGCCFLCTNRQIPDSSVPYPCCVPEPSGWSLPLLRHLFLCSSLMLQQGSKTMHHEP